MMMSYDVQIFLLIMIFLAFEAKATPKIQSRSKIVKVAKMQNQNHRNT